MISDLIKRLCLDADDFKIKLVVEDRRGAIYPTCNEMHINPEYWTERAETFVHEMLHYFYSENPRLVHDSEEQIIEMQMQSLLKTPGNRKYVLDYLDSRGLR